MLFRGIYERSYFHLRAFNRSARRIGCGSSCVFRRLDGEEIKGCASILLVFLAAKIARQC